MTDSCWHCGAAHEPRKPHRADFDSEPDFLLACLEWLDYSYPERGRDQSARIAEWRELDEAAEFERVRARLRELHALDEWTDDDEAEFDVLAEAWKTARRNMREKKS